MRPTRRTHGLSRCAAGHPVATLALVIAIAAMATMTAACSADDDRPASYEYIQSAILAPNCATIGCHSEFSAVRNHEFDDFETTYMILTGVSCDQAQDQDPPGPGGLVSAREPEGSLLLLVLRVEGQADFIMPPDRPLPGADIDLIEQWIVEGARCN